MTNELEATDCMKELPTDVGIAQITAIVEEFTIQGLPGCARTIFPLIHFYCWSFCQITTKNTSEFAVQVMEVSNEACDSMPMCIPCNVLIKFHFVTGYVSRSE